MRFFAVIAAMLLLVQVSPAQAQEDEGANVWWTTNSTDWRSNEGCPSAGSLVAPVAQDLCFVAPGYGEGFARYLSKHIYLCLDMGSEGVICRWHTVEMRANTFFQGPPGINLNEHLPFPILVFNFERGTEGPDPWSTLDPWCLGINCGPQNDSDMF